MRNLFEGRFWRYWSYTTQILNTCGEYCLKSLLPDLTLSELQAKEIEHPNNEQEVQKVKQRIGELQPIWNSLKYQKKLGEINLAVPRGDWTYIFCSRSLSLSRRGSGNSCEDSSDYVLWKRDPKAPKFTNYVCIDENKVAWAENSDKSVRYILLLDSLHTKIIDLFTKETTKKTDISSRILPVELVQSSIIKYDMDSLPNRIDRKSVV